MEKVKLPNEICKALDSYKFSDNKGLFIWSAMQTESIHEGHSLYLVRKYINDNNNSNAITIVNAILYGYEPEETEEERKEREMRENFELIVHNYLLARVKSESEIVRYSKEITDMFFQCKK